MYSTLLTLLYSAYYTLLDLLFSAYCSLEYSTAAFMHAIITRSSSSVRTIKALTVLHCEAEREHSHGLY